MVLDLFKKAFDLSLVTGSKCHFAFRFGNVLFDSSGATAHCSSAPPCICNLCRRIYNLCSPDLSVWQQSKCSLLSGLKDQSSRRECLSLPALRFLLLSQSIQSQRLIDSALWQSSYLQSTVELRSDQKVQRIQFATDCSLIAGRFRRILIIYTKSQHIIKPESYIHLTTHNHNQHITRKFFFWRSGANKFIFFLNQTFFSYQHFSIGLLLH